MQRRAAHHLHVVVALTDDADGGLAHDRERFDQQVVEGLAALEPRAELGGLSGQGVVAELADRRLEHVDVGHQALQGLELLALAGAQDLVEQFHAVSSLPAEAAVGSEGASAGPSQRPTAVGGVGAVGALTDTRCRTGLGIDRAAGAGVAATATAVT